MISKNQFNGGMGPLIAKDIFLGNLETSAENYERAEKMYWSFYPLQRETIFGEEVIQKLEGAYLKNKKSLG